MIQSAPSPHASAWSSAVAGDSVRWIVAGPSGVRVARQTDPGSIRIVGSPVPRRSGKSVRARSTGTSVGISRTSIAASLAPARVGS